ncbi:selenide, water dikinase SelD [Photorhabdus laumondii subsp. laumondii]|uniref:Selenide, water dikinase n=2 Tax=Photorhabdus laumondii subsp. laumondii TaxID=141679 RepID=SELD_PHOLL|nr:MULTISPECIES: selenide, water dikinase SelD [Photorhabdus]Q7N406.1 RecName: Full=Selenide, water dikinase; AltName: Full=Selenium donor protein; AltName: Full=Selenophosphate synthase [Photorhabdus laumondii subsp. laumondii TTO1]AWK42291.1 selenide,water dikinase SelD [Photorhabdus laumondii subsp. laumondii]AXG43138.1 selenide, water dikinase SelD [Photorhabdus laumondii subsp. laumondii]AXG47609.1 selenide, water dikinase SelD [Photorhabdus laumondii subsp. laumondii]MCC8384527.1 selenid
MSTEVRLTQYSHGAGCGCKISPKVLETILHSEQEKFLDPHLLVGNETRDDAAVYDIGNGTGIISTTDFFMPIVDDPFDFGRIAATNAISDIYAMGGKPIMAIAILGWPIDKLAPEIARKVIEGGRAACKEAGIVLAGGHSIDAPEPIFGLAVTGIVNIDRVKQNSAAKVGSQLFLTKPLGIGVLTTAEKKGLLLPEHQGIAIETMCRLNKLGMDFAEVAGITAMTDVTGFGLLGHLSEICAGSGVQATLHFAKVPKLPEVESYIAKGCVPGGTGRNFDSYGHLIGEMTELQRKLLCDPQTSGGLLLAVLPEAMDEVKAIARCHGIELTAIGELSEQQSGRVLIEVNE